LIKNSDYNEGFNRVHYLIPGISREKMGEITNAFAGYFSGLFIDANRYKTQRDDGRRGNMSTDSRNGKEYWLPVFMPNYQPQILYELSCN